MKRCIICGNVGDDSSTVCEVCGNPYVDITERVSDTASEEVLQPEEAAQTDPEAAPPQSAGDVPPFTPGYRPPRRTRSGPQIYGQPDTVPEAERLYQQQGTLRRTVPARSERDGQPEFGMGNAPEQAGRPMGQPTPGAGRPAAQGPSAQAAQITEASRRALRSPLFLMIALLFTVYLIGSAASIYLGELDHSQILRLVGNVNFPQQVAGYVDMVAKALRQLDSGAIVANIGLLIPDLLFCIGLWLIVITVRTAGERMSGVGFGFVKAIVIIHMIGACIIMLGALVLSVTIVVAAWVSGNQGMLVAAGIVLGVTILVVMMVVMYYFCCLGTLKACRLNSDTGVFYGKVSVYFAVMQILIALTHIVGLLSGIVNEEISQIVQAAGSIGWMLLLGVWVLRYRRKIPESEI